MKKRLSNRIAPFFEGMVRAARYGFIAPAALLLGGAITNSVGTLQRANPSVSTVERQPQTTASPVQGPFTRHSRKASILGYSRAGVAFGSVITDSLKPVGGYLRALVVEFNATGGTGTAAVASADAPYNVIQNLLLRDPFGEPIIQTDGMGLRLINMYGGQAGFWNASDPASLPSFSAVATSGNFRFRLRIPVEFITSDGYASLPMMNASALPTLQMTLNTAAIVYSTLPTGVPTLDIRVEQEYWVAPVDNPALAPPDVGSSVQWSQGRSSNSIGSAANTAVVLPRVGTFIGTIIAVLRDSTGARIDQFPDPFDLWIDGTPYHASRSWRRHVDAMFETFGLTRPTGVAVFTFRDSTTPTVFPDSADELLPTTPGTLLELRGTWGTITNAPATVDVYTQEIYPVSGTPYTAHVLD